MNVEIKLDREKYHALKMSMEQKGTTVEAELAQAAEVLYQKQVPAVSKHSLKANPKARDTGPSGSRRTPLPLLWGLRVSESG